MSSRRPRRQSREALQGILDGEPLVRYGSCTHSLLDRFEITAEVEIAGGDTARLRLEERLREADNLLLTGPASLQHAEVEISGERQVVSDYWRLGYSADRHNTRARYAVVLEPPVTLSRLAGAVHFVRLDAPAPEFDVHESRVFLLGEDFQILAAPSVTSYDRALAPREPAPPDDGPRFRRGDANADGRIDLIDALAVLRHLFERGTAVGCQKAADANDDGRVNILDPLAVSGRLLGRLRAFPEPASECGEDPTPDGLSCSSSCQS